jgi:hypothetical protein
MIPPLLFFVVLLAGTIAALLVQLASDRIHHRRLVGLAREWRMHYAPDDRFKLAPRVAERLSLPGAADVRVVDLIYGAEQGTRRYVFSAHYTRGVVRWKRRARCIASLSESKEGWSVLNVAPADLSVVEQYRKVADVKPENAKT